MDPSLFSAFHEELRAFVGAAGTRRALSTTCHVGHPGGQRAQWEHGSPDDDPTMRVDLVVRAIDGLLHTERAGAWITRSGDLALVDADAEWFAATRAGFAHHGLELSFFLVLNRTGWVDLTTGERRDWSRVRQSRQSDGRGAVTAKVSESLRGVVEVQSGQVCTGSLACISRR